MALLKKRSTAMVITILVVIIATLFGVHRSVGKQVKKIEAQFYEGVWLEDEHYRQAAIDDQLEVRANAALGLITVASGYDELTDAAETLRSARNDLIDAESIEWKYHANRSMQKAYENLCTAMDNTALSDRDRTGFEDYAYKMEAAQQIIDKSDYNSTVSEFINNDLRAFPINILKHLAFCDNPEYFEAEG